MKRTAIQHQNWETPWYRWRIVWLVTGIVFLFIGVLSQKGVLAPTEARLRDKRLVERGVQPLKVPIVIIAIDQPSMDDPKLSIPFTLWGKYHGQVFQKLNEFGAKAIGFDLIQPIPPFRGDEPDINLDQNESLAISQIKQLVLTSRQEILPNGKFQRTMPYNTLVAASILGGGRIADTNTQPDEDGTVRHFAPEDGENGPTFPLAVAEVASGHTAKIQNQRLTLGQQTLDLNAANQGVIDYLGPNNTFPSIPYRDFLAHPEKYRQQIKGAICLIGVTADQMQDYHNVPFPNPQRNGQNLMAGIEINANIVHTLLAGRNIREVDANFSWFFIAIGVLLAVPCAWRPRIVLVLPTLLLVSALWIGLCLLAFIHWNWQLPLLACLLAFIVNDAVLITTRLWQENQRKRWWEDAMGPYVSPQVLEYLRLTPGALQLGGKRQEVTILFSDIRGFTELSEKLEPEQVTNFLNNYLEKMVKIIFENGGTVDKFLGDGIMVIYNWPIPQNDHARRALTTAVQMQEIVLASANEWNEMGMPPINIGIGIHTGPSILGNIGSSQRMEQTAIGDTVNVASRIEGLCKTVGKALQSGILLSETTHRQAGQATRSSSGNFEIVLAGETPIRGRQEPLQLFAARPSLAASATPSNVANPTNDVDPTSITPDSSPASTVTNIANDEIISREKNP